jgi:hypothetical protein
MLPHMNDDENVAFGTPLYDPAAVEGALDQLVAAPEDERDAAQETFVRVYRDALRVSGGVWEWNLFDPLSAYHRALVGTGDEARAAALHSLMAAFIARRPDRSIHPGGRPLPGTD